MTEKQPKTSSNKNQIKKENNTNSKTNRIEKRYENSALFKGNLNIKKKLGIIIITILAIIILK